MIWKEVKQKTLWTDTTLICANLRSDPCYFPQLLQIKQTASIVRKWQKYTKWNYSTVKKLKSYWLSKVIQCLFLMVELKMGQASLPWVLRASPWSVVSEILFHCLNDHHDLKIYGLLPWSSLCRSLAGKTSWGRTSWHPATRPASPQSSQVAFCSSTTPRSVAWPGTAYSTVFLRYGCSSDLLYKIQTNYFPSKKNTFGQYLSLQLHILLLDFHHMLNLLGVVLVEKGHIRKVNLLR